MQLAWDETKRLSNLQNTIWTLSTPQNYSSIRMLDGSIIGKTIEKHAGSPTVSFAKESVSACTLSEVT